MRAKILELTFKYTNGVYRKIKGRPAWNMTTNDLLRFPEKSIGRELGEFLSKNGFEPLAQSERHDVLMCSPDTTPPFPRGRYAIPFARQWQAICLFVGGHRYWTPVLP